MLHKLKDNAILLFILLTGSIAHFITAPLYQRVYCLGSKCGLWFWNTINARDDIWHLALAASAFETFPFQMPIFSGEVLSGYHPLYSLMLHIFSLKGKISLVDLNGTLFPLIWIFFYAYLSLKIADRLIQDKTSRYIFLFMQFFGGSFAYFLTLYHSKTFLGSEGMNYQPILYLTNKPLALSILIFLVVIILLLQKSYKRRHIVFVLILLFLQWGAKFHGGVATLTLLLIFLVTSAYTKYIPKYKAFLHIFMSFVISVVAIILFYNPSFDSTKPAPLSFAPFALAHSIIESPNAIYLQDMVDARYFLYSTGSMGPRLLAIELFSAALYTFIMLGTRVIGVLGVVYLLLKRKVFVHDVWFLGTITITYLLMMLFVQHGDWFNTMQFFSFGLYYLMYTPHNPSRSSTESAICRRP